MAPVANKPAKPKSKKNKKLKKKRLNVASTKPVVEEDTPAPVRSSDEPAPKKTKWTNRQRVLVFASRGITFRDRHLLEDLRNMMPQARPDSKMEKKDNLSVINEIAEMKNCNKSIFFECKKKQDLYMWMSNISKGPSAKFLVQNVYTMGELKLTGNCLKGSRPLLSFNEDFDSHPHYQLMKELLVQIFSTPNHHPRSQPFFDHVFTFAILDNRIWFRNYQIVSEDGALAEVGPRFVLNPIKIFDGSFGGATLWENPQYKSPNVYRLSMKAAKGNKYEQRVHAKLERERNKPKTSYEARPLDDIFKGDALEAALALEAQQDGGETEMVTLAPETKVVKKKKLKKKVK